MSSSKAQIKLKAGTNLCDAAEKDPCQLNQVETVFWQYAKDILKADAEAARSAKEVAGTNQKSATRTSATKYCCYLRVDATYDQYLAMDGCLATPFDQATDEIAAKIKACATRDAEIVKAFGLAHTAIVDLKKKSGELKDAGCKLKYALTDPCHSEQMKALDAYIKDDETTAGKELSFREIIDPLIVNADEVCTDANLCFETAVKVAGIHAYLNVGSLTPLSTALQTAADVFKKDIDDNQKALADEWKKAWEEYLKAERALTTAECADNLTKWAEYSYCTTKQFACTPDCDNSGAIDPICENVEQCFITNCDKITTPPTPDHGLGKQPTGAVKAT